eukprot:TRINITY_DN1754_c0_g2_i2.p1 TRINITY_DN1754_c0_g2~~TRINITY_DN1754_c0_g2_i2.p1  ORF type:complete len:561 (-),score=110.81 TRINITY_DN1754_c0_g2_i2:102-1742(-)
MVAASDVDAVAVVDPYGSGRLLVEELCRRKVVVLAVRSSLHVNQTLSATWNPVPFKLIVVHQGDLAKTAEALQSAARVRAVIAGSDPGVELADSLAETLGTRGNGTALSRCRWDKHAMHEQLRLNGLRACSQLRCASMEEAAAFLQESAWPVVVKPCASTGTDNVYKCNVLCAVKAATATILSSKDSCGRSNIEVLIQEFLEGTEYIVDCISMDGNHLVTGIWIQEQKHWSGGFVHRSTTTLPYGGPGSKQEILREYVFKCLTALGVSNGASHCKVMLVDSASPCLIDMDASIHASLGPALWGECTSSKETQPYLVADLFLKDGGYVAQKLSEVGKGLDAYTLHRVGKHVDLQNLHSGVLQRSIEHTAGTFFKSLPSLWMSKFFVEEGDRLEPTRDVSSSPGFVILVGDSLEAVERDAAVIRKAEREGRICVFRSGGGLRARTVTEEVAMLDPAGLPCDLPIPLNAESKFRELDLQTTQLLKLECSPAQSPQMSPVTEPQLPPGELPLDDFMLEECAFTLDGLPGDVDGIQKLPTMAEYEFEEGDI